MNVYVVQYHELEMPYDTTISETMNKINIKIVRQ
jgi:hypothetical protein